MLGHVCGLSSVVFLIFQIRERRPPRVDFALLARAGSVVQVGAAPLAEPLAVLAAQVARGEREQNLFAHQFVEVYRVALVGRQDQVFRLQLDVLGLHGLDLLRDEGGVELDRERGAPWGGAAVAEQLDFGLDLAAQAHLLALARGAPLDGRVRDESRALLFELDLFGAVGVRERRGRRRQIFDLDSHETPPGQPQPFKAPSRKSCNYNGLSESVKPARPNSHAPAARPSASSRSAAANRSSQPVTSRRRPRPFVSKSAGGAAAPGSLQTSR